MELIVIGVGLALGTVLVPCAGPVPAGAEAYSFTFG